VRAGKVLGVCRTRLELEQATVDDHAAVGDGLRAGQRELSQRATQADMPHRPRTPLAVRVYVCSCSCLCLCRGLLRAGCGVWRGAGRGGGRWWVKWVK
jgi:hypothetical protein